MTRIEWNISVYEPYANFIPNKSRTQTLLVLGNFKS